MGYPAWILLFIANSVFCLWILRWGGAQWIEGWRAPFFLETWWSFSWSEEQIKFFVLLCWLGQTLWFLVGLFVPMARIRW